MPRKTTLSQLAERETAALQRLDAERKALRAIQAKRVAAEKKDHQHRWMEAGKALEEMGLPLDIAALRLFLSPHVPGAHTDNGGTPDIQAQYHVLPVAKRSPQEGGHGTL